MFLQEWDGLTNDRNPSSFVNSGPVIVIGATNRPGAIDKAFLRRMPLAMEIPLPDENGREDILKKLLENETVDTDVNLSALATLTDKFSGSDLRGELPFILLFYYILIHHICY